LLVIFRFIFVIRFSGDKTIISVFFAQREERSIDKKIKWLVFKHKKNLIQHIKPMKYFCSYPMANPSSSDDNVQITLYFLPFPLLFPLHQNQQTLQININPSTFSINDNSSLTFLTSIKNNWFINLFLIDIPHDIQCLLQLRENFSLFPYNVKNNTIELIKNIELLKIILKN